MRTLRPAKRWKGSVRSIDSLEMYMPDLCREIYGERTEDVNSSFTAFAYCYRRFGPPPRGTDDYKNLGGMWILKTKDPEVYLLIDPGGCSIDLYLNYCVSERLCEVSAAPGKAWRIEARSRYIKATGDETYAGYLNASIAEPAEAWMESMPRYPRSCPLVVTRVKEAVVHALGDLLRPVFVRDAPLNLFGAVDESNPSRGRRAERSPLAGWGVPVREMEKRIREHKRAGR